MKQTRLPRIQLDERHLPYRWQENLVKNQNIGGVLLVFLSGKSKTEIRIKVKAIRDLCKGIRGFCKSFAEVVPRSPTEETTSDKANERFVGQKKKEILEKYFS